ncbi:MAG: CAP domain-containing protein [Microthrixaceae bacterium]
MLAAVNAERAAAGVAPLSRCGTLDVAAEGHSADQAAHNNLSHTGSNGSTPPQRMTAAGYTGFNGWAENAAAGFRTVASVMNGWMGSQGHRNNILRSNMEHLGMGLAYSANGTPYWTQVFGRGGTC